MNFSRWFAVAWSLASALPALASTTFISRSPAKLTPNSEVRVIEVNRKFRPTEGLESGVWALHIREFGESRENVTVKLHILARACTFGLVVYSEYNGTMDIAGGFDFGDGVEIKMNIGRQLYAVSLEKGSKGFTGIVHDFATQKDYEATLFATTEAVDLTRSPIVVSLNAMPYESGGFLRVRDPKYGSIDGERFHHEGLSYDAVCYSLAEAPDDFFSFVLTDTADPKVVVPYLSWDERGQQARSWRLTNEGVVTTRQKPKSVSVVFPQKGIAADFIGK